MVGKVPERDLTARVRYHGRGGKINGGVMGTWEVRKNLRWGNAASESKSKGNQEKKLWGAVGKGRLKLIVNVFRGGPPVEVLEDSFSGKKFPKEISESPSPRY